MESNTEMGVLEWLHTVSSTKVEVWVENPETVKDSGFMSKPYTTFRVLLKSSDGELVGVRHRYSEFTALRDLLVSRYHKYGVYVPALPGKKIVGALDKEFITERMHGLTLFCESVVSNPFLRRDSHWLDFLTSSSSTSIHSTDTPEDILKTMLHTLPLPSLPLERMYELKDEVLVLEKKMNAVSEASRAMSKAMGNLFSATEAMANATMDWGDIERATCRYMGNRSAECKNSGVTLPDQEYPMSSLRGFSSLVVAHNEAVKPDVWTVSCSVHIDHEIARCTALRSLIKVHDEMAGNIESVRVKLEKQECSNNPKQDVIDDLRLTLEEGTAALNTFYRGIFFVTIPLCSRQRASNLRIMLERCTSTGLVLGTAFSKKIQEVMTSSNISSEESISSASKVLDTLSLPPLPHVDTVLVSGGTSDNIKSLWLDSIYASTLGLRMKVPETEEVANTTSNPFEEEEPEILSNPFEEEESRPVNQEILGSLTGDKTETKKSMWD